MNTSFLNLHRSLWTRCATACLTLLLAASLHASYKASVGGVNVSYSGDSAEAYYDAFDDTLTIVVSGTGGSLNVTVTADANANWGSYVDIYIAGDSANLKSITIKGNATCVPFLCGQVGYVTKFTLQGGVVGNTDYYGLDFGLGNYSQNTPSGINLKYAVTTAQVLGYRYTSALAAPEAAASPKARTTPAKNDKDAIIEKVRNWLR
jgi:hypothetical protein